MIQVENLTRKYGNFTAVDQVSFEINKGEVVGLLGHNGAGKTTIMKMLTGFLEPDQGQISIYGDDIVSGSHAAKSRIGYLPENLPIYPEMIVADYLDFAAGLHGLSGKKKKQAVTDAIHKTELQGKALQPIVTLSRGYKQRLGVAQAILHQPEVLILDEPTNGLDPTQTLHMRKLIRQHAKDSTVILSTHIMQEVDAVCDRVLMLRNGKLVVDEKLSVLGESPVLIVETSADLDAVEACMKQQGAVKHVELREINSDYCRYSIEMLADTDMAEAVGTVSSLLLEGEHRLYSIMPDKRDVESIFREVNTVADDEVASDAV